METSNTIKEIMSLEDIRKKYNLFSQVVKINIENLLQSDKTRKEILGRFTAAINKAYGIKEKKVGGQTEQAVVEICDDLTVFVRDLLENLKSKKIQMTQEETKQVSEEFDRCEDALRRINNDYADTAYYKSLGKGNQPFSLNIWGLQLANNNLRDFVKKK